MSHLLRRIILLSLAIDLMVFDQLSKWFVSEHIIRPTIGEEPLGLLNWLLEAPARLPFSQIDIAPFLNIVMVWNQGVSFGMFAQGNAYGTIVLIVLALIITVIFTTWLWKSTSWVQGISLALVIGGAIGNVIDRLRFGAVMDFIDIHIGGAHWPAFNIADSCVVVGISLLIFYSIFIEKNTNKLTRN